MELNQRLLIKQLPLARTAHFISCDSQTIIAEALIDIVNFVRADGNSGQLIITSFEGKDEGERQVKTLVGKLLHGLQVEDEILNAAFKKIAADHILVTVTKS